MSVTYTPNIGLGLQLDKTEYLDWDVITENWRKIDAASGGGGGGSHYPLLNGIFSVSHRGYRYNYYNIVENTMPAFEMSVKNGYRYIETDIRHTSDSVPFLHHNENVTVNELVNSTPISSINSADLATYTLLNTSLKIPTLREFLLFCKENNIIAYLEIKEGTEAQIKNDYDLVKSLGMEKSVVWISFRLVHLQYIVEKDEYTPLHYIVDDTNLSADTITDTAELKTGNNKVGIDIRYDIVTQSFIADATAAGLQVGAWTVNDPWEVIRLHKMGIDAFTTDNLRADKIINSLVTLSSSNFVRGKIKFGVPGMIDTTSTIRITYNGYDFKPVGGKMYAIKIYSNSVNSLQIGIQTMNGRIYKLLINNQGEYTDVSDIHDSLWQSSGYEWCFNPEFLINNIPPAFAWIVLRYTDNREINTNAIEKVEIIEIGEINMVNAKSEFIS